MLNYRFICDKGQLEVKKPMLPLVVIKPDFEVYESDSIRGLMCALIGSDYEDNEDEIDDWNSRIIYARKIAMASLKDGIEVIVYDKEKGIIKNNYAAASDDEDYEDDEKYNEEMKIEVSNEKEFLKSLIKLGAIVIYQRIDSNQFEEGNVDCQQCSYAENGVCNIYKFKIADSKDIICNSGTMCNINESENGGEYRIIE